MVVISMAVFLSSYFGEQKKTLYCEDKISGNPHLGTQMARYVNLCKTETYDFTDHVTSP